MWLATAFAEYERIVALEMHFRDKGLKPENREQVAIQLAAYRKTYLLARAQGTSEDVTKLTMNSSDQWYHLANGKGVLILHRLRQVMGLPDFVAMMDDFGRRHAGQEVSTQQFINHVKQSAKNGVGESFPSWLATSAITRCEIDLPSLAVTPVATGFQIRGVIKRPDESGPSVIDVAVETTHGCDHHLIRMDGTETNFTIESKHRPVRLILDKYGETSAAQPHAVKLSVEQWENAVIVYATGDNAAANRIAAQEVQRVVRTRGPNIAVPIRADQELSREEVISKHLVIVGRPQEIRWSHRPLVTPGVTFGSQSFTIGRDCYAHPGSGLLAIVAHPGNDQLSAVVIAGNSGDAAIRAAGAVLTSPAGAEIVVLPQAGKERHLLGVGPGQTYPLAP
jgi:hypothetical protein